MSRVKRFRIAPAPYDMDFDGGAAVRTCTLIPASASSTPVVIPDTPAPMIRTVVIPRQYPDAS
ncbi:hypothetical protein [Catenuloplanes indicus]|uniref:Uncharacterized protein n=1 Tax=Catenuloplanes indicus TaxID=137267 RepID=A0AAE3W5C7_9ACTN|nr:hypothetical protein [Catenuloplanes indicus]MDQ0369590.1 hypothetical protein [Catenuloplanes indicus]